MTMVLAIFAVGVVALVGTAAVHARAGLPAQKVLLRAIARQEAVGQIDPVDARQDRAAVNRTARLIARLPPARSGPLASVLAQAAAVAGALSAQRALAVFGQLAINDDWFATRGPPAQTRDITDADGIVYRYFAGSGFEFHPLANFSALNAAAANKDAVAAARLAAALIARGVPKAGGGTGWEYYFDYGRGRAPWLSGFAQAVAAQAFTRAASLVPENAAELSAAARAAFRAIPARLIEVTDSGPWIKLYSFNRDIVLNAQLQSAISLADYAAAESDPQAAALAANLRNAAAGALPRFDTGYWTYYALPSTPSPFDYQEYVVQLLQRLAQTDVRFAAAATRFAGYQTQQPVFRLADAGAGAVEFSVSKPATVRISALGGVRRLAVDGGWHIVTWRLPARPGIYPVAIHATDWAGNTASAYALPIVRVTAAPMPEKAHKRRTTAGVEARAEVSPPSLFVGAGLEQPAQASLAAQNGLHAVRMTLIWPTGASTPDRGAISALSRLPAGISLALELYAAPLPGDDAGRVLLASYAAAVAQQAPDLHDLVLGPPPAATAAAAGYEAALAAVYDAVKLAAPTVHVDGALNGEQTPKGTLAALGATYRESGRTTPLMDALAFHPAAAVAKNLWALGDLDKLMTALNATFGGTAQAGESLPLIIDDVAVESMIPPALLSLYSSPAVGATGLDEPSQAAAYAADLNTVACRTNVVAFVLHRLVDSPAIGEQSGLYYTDATPKTSLQAVVEAIAAAQSTSRSCSTAAPSLGPGSTSSGSGTRPSSPPPATGGQTTSLAVPGALVFPSTVSTTAAPSMRLGCTKACLYLVTLQRASDGAPVLARRGAASPGATITVKLPNAPIAPGSYRFVVWFVSQSNPGPVTIDRSAVVSTS